MSPTLMGLQEVAAHFGVSRQLAYKWVTKRADFPEPLAELAQGKVWDRADIVAWGRKHGRKAGEGPRVHQGGANR